MYGSLKAKIEEGIKPYDRNLLNFEKYELEEERDKIKSELKALEAESKEATEAKLKASKDEFKTDEASFNNKIEIME